VAKKPFKMLPRHVAFSLPSALEGSEGAEKFAGIVAGRSKSVEKTWQLKLRVGVSSQLT
jgi:hypothetical protein